MTTEITRPWESRERFYAQLTEVNGATVDLQAVEFAVVAEDVRPEDDDWVAADGIDDDGTTAPSAWVLIGPTGDTDATIQLARGRHRVYVRWTTVGGDERPVDTLSLVLT